MQTFEEITWTIVQFKELEGNSAFLNVHLNVKLKIDRMSK